MFLDIAYLVSLIYGMYQGLNSKLFGNVLNVLKYIVAIALALKTSYIAYYFLGDKLPIDGAYIPLISFGVMYFLIISLITALTTSAKEQLKVGDPEKNYLGKGIGGLVWFIAASFLFSGFIDLGERSEILSPTLIGSSSIYPYIADVYPLIMCKLDVLKDAFGAIIGSIQHLFGDLGDVLKGDCCGGSSSPTYPY